MYARKNPTTVRPETTRRGDAEVPSNIAAPTRRLPVRADPRSHVFFPMLTIDDSFRRPTDIRTVPSTVMTVAAEDGFMMHEAASKVAPSRATTPILEITLELRRKRWTLTMLEIAPEITQPVQSRLGDARSRSISPAEFADISEKRKI